MALARPDGTRKAPLHWWRTRHRQEPAAGAGSRTAKVKAGRRVRARLPAPAEVNRMARQHGLTPKTARSAREALKVKITRDGFGPGSKSLWSLPEGVIDAHDPT